MPVGVLGQSDLTRRSSKWKITSGKSPMPVGVLGQSNFPISPTNMHAGTPSHQCLSAFWVSRTGPELWSVIDCGASGVTNACRRFGSVEQDSDSTIEEALRGSPMPVGVLGQSNPLGLS